MGVMVRGSYSFDHIVYVICFYGDTKYQTFTSLFFFFNLRSISDYFIKVAPITRLDFTTVLPRVLSLYILSFLSPMDLCAAAQVSWYWRFLSEQVTNYYMLLSKTL